MKLTKAHLKEYKLEVNRWVEKLGLTEYRVSCHMADLGNQVMGMCDADSENGIADLYLCKEIPVDKLPVDLIKRTAQHEVIELLLYALFELASSRSFTWSECHKERHRIVRRLENLFIKEKI